MNTFDHIMLYDQYKTKWSNFDVVCTHHWPASDVIRLVWCHQACVMSPLQIIVWGDYGRMDHKSFMGSAQNLLDDLDLSNMVIGWFKLFPATSLVDPALAPLTNKETEAGKL